MKSPLPRLFCLISLFALALCHGVSLGQNVIYSSDLVSSAGWGYSHFGGISAPVPGSDSATAQFDWDYSQFGIPEAPNSEPADSPRRGLRLTANDPGIFPGDQIAVHYQDASFTGQYTLQVDVWANWASNNGAGIGTTEHAGVYVGFDPADVNAFFSPGQNGAGLLMSTDGDCSNCDYILTKDAAELDTFSGQYGETDFGFGNQPGYDNTDANANIDIPGSFPAFDIGTATGGLNGSGEQPAGAAGFQWMTVTVEVDTNARGNGSLLEDGLARFSIRSAASGNELLIGTVDNSVEDDPNDGIATGEAPVGMGGGIALMMVDFFGGNPSPLNLGFMLFDNVRVFDGFLDPGSACDLDGDTLCNTSDLRVLYDAIAAGTSGGPADLDGSGTVDNDDIDDWLADAGATNGKSYVPGDADLDGNVGGGDFTNLASNFGATDLPNAYWDQGNFDGNAGGTFGVGGGDFTALASNFGSTSVNSVPEPSGWALLSASLGLILLKGRRR